MGSVATGYDSDGDDDGDGRDDNDATTTMATAHEAGYYAHLFFIGKICGNGVTGDDNDNDDTSCEATTNRRRLLWVATVCFIAFNVSPLVESSHSFRCCAVSAMICGRVGIDVRIDSSPGAYCSMYSFITSRNN